MEIVLIIWEDDYKLAALLLAVTVGANSVVIARLYSSRLKLYQSVSHRRLIPIVHAGRVRHATRRPLPCLKRMTTCILRSGKGHIFCGR